MQTRRGFMGVIGAALCWLLGMRGIGAEPEQLRPIYRWGKYGWIRLRLKELKPGDFVTVDDKKEAGIIISLPEMQENGLSVQMVRLCEMRPPCDGESFPWIACECGDRAMSITLDVFEGQPNEEGLIPRKPDWSSVRACCEKCETPSKSVPVPFKVIPTGFSLNVPKGLRWICCSREV